ncbi:MAG: sigma-70 family RNA polymerase sigma factor [Paracoccus sp. (in: a-proteobacteria)]|nr:sigma-70 family RNA polymerase sigma factor [Paracoccus sp. (in: a-proteobacteria)]
MSDNILSHLPALRAYSRSLCRSLPDAEDLVQETLLRAIDHAARYQPGTNLRAWLLTIMRNRFYTMCHKAARERTAPGDCASTLPQVAPSQEWRIQARETGVALRELPRHYREAIILVGALGVSYIDAARILECDIGTIKSRVNRARTMLRAVLEPEM